MPLYLVTAPDDVPVTVDQAKKQCEIDESEDTHDEYLETLVIPAATERCENATRRQLLTATYDLKLDRLPACGWIEFPRPPLLTVVSFSYIDTAGVTQVWASSNYRVTAPTGPRAGRGRLERAYGVSWPTIRDVIEAITIRFTAGYGTDSDNVPARLKLAILRDCAALFENREAVTVDATARAAVELPDGSAHVYRAFKSRGTQVY